jgi:hypothetical protein
MYLHFSSPILSSHPLQSQGIQQDKMWLLETTSLVLSAFFDNNTPPYAILSHTWGSEEVSFQDIQGPREKIEHRAGYKKIEDCCAKALEEGFSYVWIDTCCIDKTSSAELSESINSMFKWYRNSGICYAYLSDIEVDPESGMATLTIPEPPSDHPNCPDFVYAAPTRPTYTIPKTFDS